MHPKPLTVAARLLAPGLVLVALVGCGGDSADTAADPTTGPAGSSATAAVDPGRPAAEAALAEGRTVIDVRTPEEFADGHVADALRIGLADPDFAARIAELDPATGYVVYCRSGNRSAQAAVQMRAAGLDVHDGGGLADMQAAGWAVET